MWDCDECGTQAIAGSLEECPVCRASRPREEVATEPGVTAVGEDQEATDDTPSRPDAPDPQETDEPVDPPVGETSVAPSSSRKGKANAKDNN